MFLRFLLPEDFNIKRDVMCFNWNHKDDLAGKVKKVLIKPEVKA